MMMVGSSISGGGTLPMNPSLASALSKHGARVLDTSINNSNTDASSLSSKKTSIQALAVHPSLPRVAYLELIEEAVSTSNAAAAAATSKTGRGTSTKDGNYSQPIVTRQRLVIQQYPTNNNNNNNKFFYKNSSNTTNKTILATLPLEYLPSQINNFRQTKSKSSKITNQRLTLASLGELLTITFLDREALFWQTARRQYGVNTNLDTASMISGGISGGADVVLLRAESDYHHLDGSAMLAHHDKGGMMGRGLCLGLQFTNVLVILRIFDEQQQQQQQQHYGATTTSVSNLFTILCCFEGQRNKSSGAIGRGVSGSGGGEKMKVQYTPTSAILPITNSIVVYGCSDGAMRFQNLVPSMLYPSVTTATEGLSSIDPPSADKLVPKHNRQSTIKSVRGPNGRNDPVVMILNVDPVYNEVVDRPRGVGGGGSDTTIGSATTAASDDVTLVLHSRLLTVCGSGVAYVWDVQVVIDRSSGALRELNVLPPLVRLDGLGSLTASPRNPPESLQARMGGGFWDRAALAKSKDGSTPAPYLRIVPAVSYDPHRNLLVWTLPPSAPVPSIDHSGDYDTLISQHVVSDHEFLTKWALENGGFAKVWDLSLVDTMLSPSSSPRPPPKVPPIAIVKLPTIVASAVSPHSLIDGLPHAPISTASIACVSLSQDRTKLLVHSAPLPRVIEETDISPESTESLSLVSPIKSKHKKLGTDVEKSSILYVNYKSSHAVSLNDGVLQPLVRGSAVSASFISPDIIAVATDQGVAIVNIAERESWASKLAVLSDDRRSKLLIGDDDKSRKQSFPTHIAVGPFHTIISIGGVGNLPGILFVEDHAVFASRLRSSYPKDGRQAQIKKVNLNDPVMLCKLQGGEVPWRQIRSTRMSNFVEILRPLKCPPRLMPSPSGRYLCLFWNNNMKFEILHAGSLLAREQASTLGPLSASLTPSVDSGSNVLSFAWVGDDDHFAILRQNRDVFSVKDGASSGGQNYATFSNVKRQCRSTVQLFKLAEVKIDAVELAAGASVAAATVVSLGSLTVRGGDHVVPNALFGGPTLCICCVSTLDRSGCSDHVAYFYSPKSGALEKNDERASAYTAIGTSIPYPDLVIWDENGKLCAVSYGARVAIYLCENSKFMLLGSVYVLRSTALDAEISLISMKFIHGVLYCTTQSSVHVIFLGNVDDDDIVCELDEFIIATDGVPLCGTDNPDTTASIPIITSLKHPHILAYHSGGLLLSTQCGLRLLSLSHPIVRIGTLLAANLTDKARKWISAMPKAEHDNLAQFLIRRGHADLVFCGDLDGLSLETYIDLCMRYDRTDDLENLFESKGTEIVPEISNWGRDGVYSAYFSIGIYMLGKGKIDCAKRLVDIAADTDIDELLVDAMKLATYVSGADRLVGKKLSEKIDNMDFNSNGQLALLNVL